MDPGGSYSRHSSVNRIVEPTQIIAINTNTKPPTATGMMRSREYVTIDINHMVGAVRVTPSVGEQWLIIRDGGIWRLDRQIPFNTPAILEESVPGQVRIGSTGPVTLAGSEVQVNSPLRISSYSTTSRPPASAFKEGTQIFDTTLGKPLWSNGKEWQGANAVINGDVAEEFYSGVLNSAAQNGVSVVFPLPEPAAVPSQIEVYRNGLREIYGIGFTATANELTFTTAPLSSDSIVLTYHK